MIERQYKRLLKKNGIHVKRVHILRGWGETFLLPYVISSHATVELFSHGQVYKSYRVIYERLVLNFMEGIKEKV